MQCSTTENLLQANVDYLSYHITLKLRRIERNPGVLNVVGVVMKHCTMDVLPSLEEIVEDVLARSNVNYEKNNSYSFLKVFHTFVICVKRLVKIRANENIKEKDIQPLDKAEIVIRQLLEYYQAKKVSERLDDEPEEEETSESKIEDEELQNYESYKGK